MMRPQWSSTVMFKGTRAPRGGRTIRGSLLAWSEPWRPPAWLLAAAGLAALVIAVLVLSHGASTPSAPKLPQVAVSAPHAPTIATPPVGGPSIHTPSLPGLRAPGLPTPHVSAPHPHISSPGISTPELSLPGVSAPHVGSPEINIDEPGPPDLHEPSFHISFGWLFDFFSICWRIFIFFFLIPWWVILLALLLGRALWVLWERRRESRDGGKNEE